MTQKTDTLPSNGVPESTGAAKQVAAPGDIPRSRVEAPWIILVALLLATILAAYQSNARSKIEAQARFEEMANHGAHQIADEIRHIEDAIALAGAVIASSPRIDNLRWNTYLDARKVKTAPVVGLVRLEYRAVRPVKRRRLPHQGGATIRPVLPPSLIRDTSEEVLLVRQLSSSVLIDEAIVAARATRKSVMTSALVDKSTMKPDQYIAWVAPVYASFNRSNEPLGFMVAILSPASVLQLVVKESNPRLILSISDNGDLRFNHNPDTAVPNTLVTKLPMRLGQRDWILNVEATPALADELSSQMPATILLVGVLGTLSLVGLVWLLTRLREQAATLANSMTLKLRDHVKFTDDLIELNPNPIYRKDANGRYVAVNRAWEHLAKRDRIDVIGKTGREFQIPLEAEISEKFDLDVLNSSSGFEAREEIVTNAAGDEVPTILAKQVIRRADGTIDGIICTITDVTPIKQLEREVARQREQLDLVIRSSQQGIFDVVLMPEGKAYYSERFREILGLGAENITAKLSWEDWIFPADEGLFRDHLIEHLKRKTPYLDVECRALRGAGGEMWLRVRGVAQFDVTGTATRFVGSIVDVTERREAELKLIDANIRVMEAARAKEAFLATMSHEIRTPMNGVLGIAGLLADTQLNDEQQDYIRLIRASGDTLLRLINDVLDFSKIESGHMAMESVSVELAGVIEDAFELVAEKAREKKLALVYDSREDIPDYVLGDATRLRQIFLNILSNAIKFTDEGEIALAVSCRELADLQIELTVRISDTGIGIPAERIQQLFQPFTQVDASTTRKYGGTGLGLAIVKRLVTMMGGTVSLESVEGKGSVFSFTIITRRANGPRLAYMRRDVPGFAGKQILLVDANPLRREAMAHLCRLWGFGVVTSAPDHVVAELKTEAATGRPVDILLTDMLLPSPETDALRISIEAEDSRRVAAGAPRIIVILMSMMSRAALSNMPEFTPIRHDMLVVQPASRTRIFDVLEQAAMARSKNDVATRPFTRVPTYDVGYEAVHKRGALAVPMAANVAAGPVTDRNIGALNILVAEDNEVNQRVIHGMLKRIGHRATIVPDGQAAVDAMSSQKQNDEAPYDIVLMDIHMPVLDGVSAMKAIKNLFNQTDDSIRMPAVPIVAMTAHALAGDREHYLNEGMDDYISKPIRSEELAALLLRAVPQKRLSRLHSQPLSPEGQKPLQGGGSILSQRSASPLSVASAPIAFERASPGMDVPILDLEQLEDLRGLPAGADDGTEAGENGLIELFKEKSRERLSIIGSCLIDSNWVLLGDTAHSLRGAAASVGFPRVAVACKTLELMSRRLSPVAGAPANSSPLPMPTQAELDEVLIDIKLHFVEAEAALAKWLA